MFKITNHVKNKILQKKDVVGIWSIIPNEVVTEILASTGLDFIILDMEHGSFNPFIISKSVQAVSAYECSPLVRIPEIDHTIIQRVLDIGSHGIVCPQIRTVSDAELLVEYSLFPPKGRRGYNPFTKAGDYSGNSDSAYMDSSFPLIVVIIENLVAYSNLDCILKVEGIDVFYLGIYDMSCNFGVRGELTHPLVQEFVNDATNKIKAAGKTVGYMIDNYSLLKQNSEGNFLVLKPDTFQLKKSIMDII